MFEKRQLHIIRDSEKKECTIEFSTTEPWELRMLNGSKNMVEYCCSGLDLFDCLTQLRGKYLEKNNCYILCYGACIDVYPSRMSRQMSGGRKAYIMHIGQPVKKSDMVDIFDPVEDFSRIATVSEQEEYLKKWMESF